MHVTAWKVYRNGKDLGIVESNYRYASQYWKSRATSDNKYKLIPIG